MNVNKLRAKIVENGSSMKELAIAMEIAPSTLWRKMSPSGQGFTIEEANQIRTILNLTTEESCAIFFPEQSHKCNTQS